jgi:hypothetical protein
MVSTEDIIETCRDLGIFATGPNATLDREARMNLSLSDRSEDVQKLMAALDKDSSGSISFDEFLHALATGEEGLTKLVIAFNKRRRRHQARHGPRARTTDSAAHCKIFTRAIAVADTRLVGQHRQAYTFVELIIFVLYPGVCNTCFSALFCRDLSPDVAVLGVDYSIDCGSDTYGSFFYVALLCIVLGPLSPS